MNPIGFNVMKGGYCKVSWRELPDAKGWAWSIVVDVGPGGREKMFETGGGQNSPEAACLRGLIRLRSLLLLILETENKTILGQARTMLTWTQKQINGAGGVKAAMR